MRHREAEQAAMTLPQFQASFPHLAEPIVALHAHGVPGLEILRRVSTIARQPIPSAVVEALIADARREALDWQNGPLEPSYPIIVFERMRLKWRDAQGVSNKACCFALGYQAKGPKEILGFWIEGAEERQFWTDVLGDLRRRGVFDAFYLVGPVNRLSQAQSECFPAALVLPHAADVARRSAELVKTKDRSAIASALRAVLCAADIGDARRHMDVIERGPLGRAYPSIAPLWRRHWQELEPFFAAPSEIRRVLASTHAADALRRRHRRASRGQVHLSSNDGATVLMHFVVREAVSKWKRSQREWHAAKLQLAALFPERFAAHQ